MNWSPAMVQALMSIAVLAGIGLAVVGQVRWRATKEWESLADARQQRISELERDMEFTRARITALEAQLAEVQRVNLNEVTELQRLNLGLQRSLEGRLKAVVKEGG
jgi:hypothetical protein